MNSNHWNSKTSFKTCFSSTDSFRDFKDCKDIEGWTYPAAETEFPNDVPAHEKFSSLTYENRKPVNFEYVSMPTPFNQTDIQDCMVTKSRNDLVKEFTNDILAHEKNASFIRGDRSPIKSECVSLPTSLGFTNVNDCEVTEDWNYPAPDFTYDVPVHVKMTSRTCDERRPIKARPSAFSHTNIRSNVSICSFKECCSPENCTHIQSQNVQSMSSYFLHRVPTQLRLQDSIFVRSPEIIFNSEALRTEAPQAETLRNESISASSAAEVLVNKSGGTKNHQHEELSFKDRVVWRKYTLAQSKETAADDVNYKTKKELKKAEKERLKQEQKQKKEEQKLAKGGKTKLKSLTKFGFHFS